MDIKLDVNTGDIDLTNSSASLVDGRDQIHQHLRIRLQWFLSEWFLNRDLGIPYFDRIFIRGVNEADVVAIYTDIAINTPGILSVDAVTLNPDFENREMTVNMLLTDINGSFDFTSLIEAP